MREARAPSPVSSSASTSSGRSDRRLPTSAAMLSVLPILPRGAWFGRRRKQDRSLRLSCSNCSIRRVPPTWQAKTQLPSCARWQSTSILSFARPGAIPTHGAAPNGKDSSSAKTRRRSRKGILTLPLDTSVILQLSGMLQRIAATIRRSDICLAAASRAPGPAAPPIGTHLPVHRTAQPGGHTAAQPSSRPSCPKTSTHVAKQGRRGRQATIPCRHDASDAKRVVRRHFSTGRSNRSRDYGVPHFGSQDFT